MHSQNISTKKPGLVLFLIDQSSSMLHGWGGDRDASKSQLAADALNKTLYDLALNACMKDGRPVDRVHIGAYYYSDSSARWAIGTISEGKGWATAQDWVPGYHHIDKIPVSSDGNEVIEQEIPVWFFPDAGGWTPMIAALNKASKVVKSHVTEFPDSYPPIVINISDGCQTDGDFDDLIRAAKGVKSAATNDGDSLLLNIQITEHNHSPMVFPTLSQTTGSPQEVLSMAEASSELPANMLVEAKKFGMSLQEGAKGLILDADWTLLTRFLRIGTTLNTEVAKPTGLLTSGTEVEA